MQHLDEGTIHAWLDGQLGVDEARELETHIGECTECAAAVAEARGFAAAASRILTKLDDVPAGVLPVTAPVSSAARLSPARPRWWNRSAVRAAATIVVVAGGSWLAMRDDSATAAAITRAAAPLATSAPELRAPQPVVRAESLAVASKDVAPKRAAVPNRARAPLVASASPPAAAPPPAASTAGVAGGTAMGVAPPAAAAAAAGARVESRATAAAAREQQRNFNSEFATSRAAMDVATAKASVRGAQEQEPATYPPLLAIPGLRMIKSDTIQERGSRIRIEIFEIRPGVIVTLNVGHQTPTARWNVSFTSDGLGAPTESMSWTAGPFRYQLVGQVSRADLESVRHKLP